jgi:predicted nucleotidyltransferase
MTSILLDITNKVDPNTLAVLQSVAGAAQRLAIPLFVIGATARDLVLHHYYGAQISRATQDLDFAIQILDWSAFEALKTELLQTGFSETRTSHRLDTSQGGWIDLVPFGPISNDGKAVAWPPKGDVVMSILGFSEAYEHALQVRINELPTIDIPVVSPVGLALLKLVSWTERKREKRPNDARDLLYLCTNYREIPEIKDEIFGQEDMMEAYGWVLEQGAAFLLGRDVRAIAASDTNEYLEQLFNEEIVNRPLRELVMESCENSGQFEEHEARLKAFIDGYRSQ